MLFMSPLKWSNFCSVSSLKEPPGEATGEQRVRRSREEHLGTLGKALGNTRIGEAQGEQDQGKTLGNTRRAQGEQEEEKTLGNTESTG